MPLPGIRLPLRIFEPRYVDMLRRQLRAGRGFVITQIYEGADTGPASFFPLGVEVSIVDWDALPDGLLGITVEGQRVQRVLAHNTQPDGLIMGQCEVCNAVDVGPDGSEPLADWDGLAEVLAQLKSHPSVSALALPEVTDSCALGWQLLQLLPLPTSQRQQALPLAPRARLLWLARVLDDLSRA